MEFNAEKVKTYVGFAIKSRKIKFGVDDILKSKKTSLILVSEALGGSGTKKLDGYALKNSVDLIKLNSEEFQCIVQNISVKAIAILDNNLADAIKKNLAKF